LFRGTRRVSVDYRPEQSGARAREEGELKTERQEETMKSGEERRGEIREVRKRKRQQTGESVAAPLARQHVKGQRKDEEKGEENNSRHMKKTKRGERGKFSIKLHGNGGWLTRGVGWTDERMDGRRDAPIVIQITVAYKRRQKFAVKCDALLKRAKRVAYLCSRCQFSLI